MRASAVGAIFACAVGLGSPALAELARPSGGNALGSALDGFGIVFAIGIVGCIAVSVGTILTARIHRRRREARHPCVLSVRLEPSTGTPVRLVDISRRGARLRMMLPPLPGAKVKLRWDDLALEATVVWSGEVFAGLRFRNTLPRAVMMRLIAAGAQVPDGAAHGEWLPPRLGA